MPEHTQTGLRRGSRPWLLATVLSGLLLVAAIVVGLAASLGRLGETMDLLEQPGTHPDEIARLAEESARTTRLSLYLGAPVALVYLTSLIMYRRSRKAQVENR